MTWLDRALQWYRIQMVRRYIRPGTRVLDIGCADGGLFRHLGQSFGVGLDPYIEKTTTHGRYTLIKGHFPHNLSPGEPYEIITLLAVVEHIPEDKLLRLARDCRGHLQPEGRILITVPDPFVDKILVVLKKVRLVDGMSLEQHHGLDVHRIPQIFGSAGLRLERHQRFQWGLNNLYVFRRQGDAGHLPTGPSS